MQMPCLVLKCDAFGDLFFFYKQDTLPITKKCITFDIVSVAVYEDRPNLRLARAQIV